MYMSSEIKRECIRVGVPIIKRAMRDAGLKVGYYRRDMIVKSAIELAEKSPVVLQQAWDNCKMRYEAKRLAIAPHENVI